MIRSLARSVAPLLPAEERRPGPATRLAGRTLRRLHRLEMKIRGHSAQARYGFSIGILRGPSPFLLRAAAKANPVLTAAAVSDVPAEFVADPFMIRRDGGWHMFFEVLNTERDKGEIAHAFSANGLDWTYDRVVLSDPFHLSYPYLLEQDGDIYMVPECCASGQIRLYKAAAFPYRWEFVRALRDDAGAEPSPFEHDGRWWMFAETAPGWRYDCLRLFHADTLFGPWLEHPESPVVDGNARIARPSGRVIRAGGKLVRFAQDCLPEYGTTVNALEIVELTPTTYRERWLSDNPVVTAGAEPWNRFGAHHIDAHELGDGSWIACVDAR